MTFFPSFAPRTVSSFVALALLVAGCSSPQPQVGRAPVAEAAAEAGALVQPSPAQLACMTEAIYFEAGARSEAGRAAVAHVILNRAEDPRFPGSVCEVIREGEARSECQFAYRCEMDVTLIRWPDKHANAARTAERVMTGQTSDPTSGALFFHAASAAPGWFLTRERRGEYGGNIFYR